MASNPSAAAAMDTSALDNSAPYVPDGMDLGDDFAVEEELPQSSSAKDSASTANSSALAPPPANTSSVVPVKKRKQPEAPKRLRRADFKKTPAYTVAPGTPKFTRVERKGRKAVEKVGEWYGGRMDTVYTTIVGNDISNPVGPNSGSFRSFLQRPDIIAQYEDHCNRELLGLPVPRKTADLLIHPVTRCAVS